MHKRKHKDQCGNWMDTYGDMVTLLLCFFVLLYAISAIDQTKWANLVRSLNPNSVTQLEEATQNPPEGSQAIVQKVPEDFQTLYENLKAEVEEKNLNTEIEVKAGKSFTFIAFKDKIFFDGYSYVLKKSGEEVLEDFCNILAPYADDIKQIEILGHTARVDGHQYSVANDRFLASNRATAVLVYIQEKNFIDPSKLTSVGYGDNWPVADNYTPEGRSANRRVEVLITKTGAQYKNLGELYREIQYGTDTDEGQE